MLNTRVMVLSVAMAMAQGGFAADLFESGGKLRQIAMNDPIVATDTVGGFAIYQGDGGWKFEQGSSTSSSGGSQTLTIPMGSFVINQFIGGEFFQRLAVTSTLGSTGGRSWSGTPCSPDHLVMKNKGRGREDHCMTIDPMAVLIGVKNITFLSIKITNSAGGRYQSQNLMLNPNLLGNRDTGPGDWSQAAIAVSPHRQALLEKLTIWGEQYLDASMKAFDYSQPQDAYTSLPSVRTLIPAIAEFPMDKYSLGFLSALEDLKHRPGAKALAYYEKTAVRTPHQYYYALNNQVEANKKALEGCNQRRVTGDAECKLVALDVIQSPGAK